MNNFLFPLNAIHRDGTVILLYTLDDVFGFVKKYGRFYNHHVDTYWYFDSYGRYCEAKTPNNWILRDDRGRVVKYDDIPFPSRSYSYWNERNAKIRKLAEKGLPIPYTACRKAGRKINHTAKKNSGAGARNRNRALCEYDRKEYGIKNPYGVPVSWEGY